VKVVVIGGTGLIGSKLVAKLGEHGHEAVPAAPNTGVNTLTGEGLAGVLEVEVEVEVETELSSVESSRPEEITPTTDPRPPRRTSLHRRGDASEFGQHVTELSA
jgi:NAD(P)-dependent dehydrogenase (short-subunit alcohol dehydrogenase family)